MPSERTVHIVDDNAAVRRSLERLLQAAEFATVAYPTAHACLDAAASLTAGCMLIDVRMPGIDGIELHARLKALGIHLPVIVMTGDGDIPTAVKAMKAGAVDFLEKPFDDDRLLTALEAALAHAPAVTRSSEAAAAAHRIAKLSPRERQVLDALVTGCANKVVAADLGISVRTVEIHRARMLARLGTRRLAEAVRLVVMVAMMQG